MRTRALLLAACTACAAQGCATARPAATSAPAPAASSTAAAGQAAAAAAIITPGLTAGEVRRRLGDPQRVERIPSAVAQGAAYERWHYGEREVVLLDGRVIDVVP